MESWREETEWSASTATMPLELASPLSLIDGEDGSNDEDGNEEDEEWATQTTRESSHSGRTGLRALLLEMDGAGSSPHGPTRSRENPKMPRGRDGNAGGDAAARVMELRHAEDRVRTLEARLLDAEETIHHLKAEKMEAWRSVERLSQAMEGNRVDDPDVVVRLRSDLYELQGQLRDAQTQHAVEQEERMAVIREQEREIMLLKTCVADERDRADDVDAKYQELRMRLAAASTDPHKRLVDVDANNNNNNEDNNQHDDPTTNNGHSLTMKPSTTVDAMWTEECIRHPTPHFDLDSAEVQYLLCAWTTNPKKFQYLRTWLTQVALQTTRNLPLDFPLGVELPRLAPEIRDGFLTLVVPLLRKQPFREIQVHTKQYNDQFHTDLRIRVVPRKP